MAKSIAIRHGEKSTNSDYLKRFPPFLWILRDTTVRMPQKDGKELTPTEYLNTEVLGGDDNPASMEVAIRRTLTEFFPTFICQTLPPPSTDIEVMERITTKQDQLTPLFNQGVNELIAFLKKNIHTKKVLNNNGALCDGPTLALLVEQVAEAVNDPNSIPALDNTWKLVVQSRCRGVQEKLVAQYCTTIKTRYDSASKGGPLEEEIESGSQTQCVSVIGIHNKLWTEIKEMLHNKIGPLLFVPLSEECTLESVTDQLEKQLVQFQQETIPHTKTCVRKVSGGALYTIAKENRKRSREYCNKLFTDLFTQIRRRVESAEDGYTAERLQAEIKALCQEYDKKSIGPEKMYIRIKMEEQIEENRSIFEGLIQRAQQHKEFKEICTKLLTDSKKDFEERMQAEKERREQVEKQLKETQKSLDEEKKRMNQETQTSMKERHKRERAEESLKQMNQILEERQKVAQERLDEEKQRTKKAEAHLEKVTDQRDKLNKQLTEAILMKQHAEERLADKAYQLQQKTEEANKKTKEVEKKTKEVEKKTKEVEEKTKEAKEKTKEVEEKTKEAEKLDEYIEKFENSSWIRRLMWTKRTKKGEDASADETKKKGEGASADETKKKGEGASADETKKKGEGASADETKKKGNGANESKESTKESEESANGSA